MATTTRPPAGGKQESGTKQQRLAISMEDRRAIQHVQCLLRDSLGKATFTDAARMCIVQQDLLDGTLGAPNRQPVRSQSRLAIRLIAGLPSKERYERVRADALLSVIGHPGPGRPVAGDERTASKVHNWIMKLKPEHMQAIQRIMKSYSLSGIVDAVRFAVRVQAALTGFKGR